MHEHHNNLEEKVNDLTNKMNQKMEEVALQMSQLMNRRSKEHEETENSAVEGTQKRVEEKVDKLMESMEKQRKTESHLVHDCVEEAVRMKLQEDREEAEEVNKRRTSIIIHGMKESDATELEDMKKEDEEEIVNLLHEIKCDDISVQTSYRLGRRDETAGAKPRPMRVIVSSENQKNKVLNFAKNLKHTKHKDLEKVYIHQDLTPKQRQQRAALVLEMKQRQSSGETNLIIVNGKIVVRRARNTPETSA